MLSLVLASVASAQTPITGNTITSGSVTPLTSGNAVGSFNLYSASNGPSLNFGIVNTGSTSSNYGWLQTAYANSAGTYGILSLNPLGGNVGIGTVSPLYWGSNYTDLSINNAGNGGIIDFLQNGQRKASFIGDNYGLSLVSIAGPIQFYSNNTLNMSLLANGNFGINTTSPVAKLHVNGTLLASGNSGNSNIDPNGSNADISFLSGTGRVLIGWNRSSGEGETDLISNQGAGTAGGFAFYDYSNVNGSNPGVQTELMRVRANGQVLIGVTNFTNSQSIGTNKLAVGGGIITEAITVKLQGAPWPDYVFKPKFKLQPLSEVKAYIDANHHLPDIPSEADIAKNGQNLGEMNELLMKKVEELTLYLINQKKDSDKQLSELIDAENALKVQNKKIIALSIRLKALEEKR